MCVDIKMSEAIHLHNQHHFDKTKLFILMIPCLVFLLVLALFMTITSYNSPTHSAVNTVTDNGGAINEAK